MRNLCSYLCSTFLVALLFASNVSEARSTPIHSDSEYSETTTINCNLNDVDEKELANTICKAYSVFSSCSSDATIEQALLDQCCACFDLCCTSGEDSEAQEELVTIQFPGKVQQPSPIKRSVVVGRKGNNTKNADVHTRCDRRTPCKPRRRPDAELKRTFNKFANTTLKNSTEEESNNGTESESIEEVSTTPDPCLEFASGASKSQVSSTKKDIPKGLNCTGVDLLEQLIPSKPQSTPKKRDKRSNNFEQLLQFEKAGFRKAMPNFSGKTILHSNDDKLHGLRNDRIPEDDTIWDTEEIPAGIPKRGKPEPEINSSTPVLLSAPLEPKERPGKCQVLKSVICSVLLSNSMSCTKGGDCPGRKKCCFYECKPQENIGICQIPVLF